MGIDARIYVADGDLITEMKVIIQPNAWIYAERDLPGKVYRHTCRDGRCWIIYDTWHRYYGPNYEKGHWPSLRAEIEFMRTTFQRPVYYHGDFDWFGDQSNPITDVDLAALDEAWARRKTESH